MDDLLRRNIELLCDDFQNNGNHVLLYGKRERTLAVMKGVYNNIKKREEFLCSWHDASLIKKPMDFFEPIIKLKYGAQYERLKEKDWFKQLIANEDDVDFSFLANLCEREEKSADPNKRKMPVMFIDGIEKLFFNMDYGHLDEKDRRKLLTEDFLHQPGSKVFGNALRSQLHQLNRGLFYGIVRNPEGLEYKATFGNEYYMFYALNFLNHHVWESR